ncbi:MAG: glycoside hydrolase family 2 protein [Anaerolineaceae bacterium]|nr:MAG: glycoside hydrolase family 2 protein [Anaerolineaceae bacterium]
MIKQSLNGIWELRRSNQEERLKANVPGSVYQTLLENEKMEDPFWKDNEDKALELMQFDYEYILNFDADEKMLECKCRELVFDGIDTIAEIYLNDNKLGNTDNMHRQWRFSVNSCLRKKDNELRVILYSPTKYIEEAYKKCISDGSSDAMTGFANIRKAHYMYGWDWGPHLPDAGIWRNVYLEANDIAKINSLYIRQEHKEGNVTLRFEVDQLLYRDCKTEYTLHITDPDGNKKTWSNSPEKIKIDNPKLWWPNGLGEQPLYKVEIHQYVNGVNTDSYKTMIGLRTLTMYIEDDEWGSSFAHRINGIDCFAMGADYIPEDNLLGRVNRDTTYKLLQQCKDANFNTIRVWGGGYYPDDWFYEICDELGLMVWQDFMFACAVYELTEEFEENISIEIKENIIRIRNHACLALWCGNNEMEAFVKEGLWVTRPSQKAHYIMMYEYIIPKLIKQYDPDTFYWPSSPSSGGSFDDPSSADRGDVHYWAVWHGNLPFSDYRNYYFRYMSEFGFQAFPSVKTIETFTDDERDKNIFSYVMEKHQRNFSANGKIMNYLQQTYLYPTKFETLIYASQLLQAEAVSYGIEHFRRNRGRCMGAIYWQLNDCWPVASWSSIDYLGRWKALHYYVKRLFAPLMISCEEEGMLTQNMNINDAKFAIQPSARLNVVNESRKDRIVEVRYSLRKNTGEIIQQYKETLSVNSLSSTWLEKKEFHDIDIFKTYFSYELYEEGLCVSEGSVIFSVPKYFQYIDPKLSYEIDGDSIKVKADTYAKSVQILNDNEDLILSDNYFDMNPGIKTVKIIKGNVENLRLSSVYDIR